MGDYYCVKLILVYLYSKYSIIYPLTLFVVLIYSLPSNSLVIF